MPSYFSLVAETMLFALTSKPGPKRLAASASPSITTLRPDSGVPTKDPPFGSVMIDKVPDLDAIAKIPVWSWKTKASAPHELTNLTCRVRSMNMDYKMAMPVCDNISIENVTVTTPTARIVLPLTEKFVVDKFTASGHIPAATTGLWQLKAEIDESLLIVFAYRLKDGNLEPISQEQIVKLDDKFMPSLPTFTDVVVGDTKQVFTSSLRVLVCIGFTFGKENPDFTPGGPLGMYRAYPHVMIMASSPLESVQGDIVVHRPATTPHTGPMANDTYSPSGATLSPVDTMGPNLVHELMTDTNSAPPLSSLIPPLPMWNQIFEYYETDPLAKGIGFGEPLVMVDPTRNKPGLRSDPGVRVKKLLVLADVKYLDSIVKKSQFQGEFDNLHVAPRMGMGAPLSAMPGLKTENIAMAPFCVHDCLHIHTRWGDVGGDKPTLGFNASGIPYREKMAPMVPHNQTVTLQLLKPAGFRYRFKANGPVLGGTWTVGCHHGMAYPGDVWDDKVEITRLGVEKMASDERDFGARTALNSWATFYWRLRWGGTKTKVLERLVVPDLDAARSL